MRETMDREVVANGADTVADTGTDSDQLRSTMNGTNGTRDDNYSGMDNDTISNHVGDTTPTTHVPVPVVHHGKGASTPPPKTRQAGSNMICRILRIVCLDFPFIIVLTIYLSIHHLHWLSYNYLVPLNHLQYFDTHERDISYYHRVCTKDDQTTHDAADLLVDIRNDVNTNSTTGSTRKIDVAVQQMLRHGVTIIPDLISESTAVPLRDYILEQNKINEHLIYVIENQFRWSFPIQVDQDPIIARALQEILNNDDLIDYLEAVMGPNPAIIEFTAITQAYGAKEQFWHQDGTSLSSCGFF